MDRHLIIRKITNLTNNYRNTQYVTLNFLHGSIRKDEYFKYIDAHIELLELLRRVCEMDDETYNEEKVKETIEKEINDNMLRKELEEILFK